MSENQKKIMKIVEDKMEDLIGGEYGKPKKIIN